MALQSSFYNTDGTTRTYPSTKHIATKQHVSVYGKRVSDSTWVILAVDLYELVNNSIVFGIAPDTVIYSQIEIRVADTTAELEDSPSDIAIVAGAITDVINVSNNISVIDNVNDNMGAITTVSANTTNLNSIVDDVIPNLPEILLADYKATIATTKAIEASMSATLAQGYAESIIPSSLVKNIDTIADLATIDPTIVDTDNVFVKDLDRGGLFVWSSTGTANGGTVFAGLTGYWVRQYSGAVNVKWFGAKGDGVTDDTNAIQNAIDTGKEIYFPEGTYLISDTIEAESMTLYGDEAFNASTIKANFYTTDKPMLKTTGYYTDGKYTSFTNLTIDGYNSTNKTAIGVELINDSAEDIDAYFKNCNFKFFLKGISCKGRGLKVTDSIFAALSTAIYLDRNDPVIEGANPDQKTATGFRAFSFVNNRFHGMGYGKCIEVNTSTTVTDYLIGVLFTDNYIDTPAQIFNGGGLIRSVFANNIHIYTGYSMPSLFESDYNWEAVSITGNTFGNVNATGYFYGKIVDVTGDMSRCNISNNIVRLSKYEFITATGYANQNVISGNTLYGIGQDLENNSFPIIGLGSAGKTADGNVITDNTCLLYDESSSNVQANFDYFVQFIGTATTGSVIKNNSIPSWAYVSNKQLAETGEVLGKWHAKQAADVIRNDTNAADQLLISQDVKKKTPTSNLLVEFHAHISNGLGEATNLPSFKIYVDDVWYGSTNFYVVPASSYLSISGSIEVTTDNVDNIKLYVSDATSSAQNFTVRSNTTLLVTEVQG